MSDYVKINAGSKKGDLLISRSIFEQLATEATNRVNGASVSKSNRRRLFNLSRPVQAVFQKNGRVKITVSIDLKKGTNANEICLKIQEEVANSLMAYTESVPFDVQIDIVEIR